MADWFPGEIKIGGKVPAALKAELAKAVAETGRIGGWLRRLPLRPRHPSGGSPGR